MKIFGYEIKKAKPLPNGSQYHGFKTMITDSNANNYVQQGLLGNADVYSIVTLSSRKFSSIPIYVYDIRDKQALKQYKTLMSNPTKASLERASLLRRKALGEADDNSDLARLLNKPNSMQGQDVFWEQVITYKMITGGSAIYMNSGGMNIPPVELQILPSQFLQILGDGTLYGVSEYRILLTPLTFKPEEIIYWKYPNFDFQLNGRHLYGLSPLKAAINVLQASNDGIKAQVAMMQNQGARGILFDESDQTLSPEQMATIKQYVNDEVNAYWNKGKIGAVNAKLGFLQFGLSATDLQLLEAINMNKEQLCNVFGVPSGLLKPDTTYDNRSQDMKYFITNKIVPEWCNLRDELNTRLKPRFKGTENLYIDFDVQDLPELQEDVEKMVNTLKSADWLTDNEKRVMMRQERIEQPAFDTAYKNQNMIPIESAFEQTGGSLPDNEVEETSKGIY